MDPQQALQLKDIHIYTDPNIWPLAIGWWILLVISLLILITLVFKVRKQLRIKKHKKLLLEEFLLLERRLTQAPDKEVIADTNILLRRLALAYYPEENVASLTGGDWLHFLDATAKTQNFSQGAGRVLIEAPYRSGAFTNFNGEEFIPLIRNWVNKTIRKVGGCI